MTINYGVGIADCRKHWRGANVIRRTRGFHREQNEHGPRLPTTADSRASRIGRARDLSDRLSLGLPVFQFGVVLVPFFLVDDLLDQQYILDCVVSADCADPLDDHPDQSEQSECKG